MIELLTRCKICFTLGLFANYLSKEKGRWGLISSAEHEVKDSRRSGMSQSCFFGDKIGHAKSIGFRFYSAV